MVYQGFWDSGTPGSPDNQNAGLLQRTDAASRPAVAKEGVMHHASDTEVVSRDNGSIWENLGILSMLGARIKTGSYVGDDTTAQPITGVGFRPKFLAIFFRITAGGSADVDGLMLTTTEMVDDNASGLAMTIISTNGVSYKTNAIISLDADGFTVDDNGANEDPNASGVTYLYLAVG
jgi:hypothetical protein